MDSETDEVWKPIPGFDGYEVSNLGGVRSYKKQGGGMRSVPRLLKPSTGRYASVNLRVDGRNVHKRVHRLVLLTFVGPCKAGMEACHNNGDGLDNRLENLRYDTHASNMHDAYGAISSDDIVVMREERARGRTHTSIAGERGLNIQRVAYICRHKTYKNVGGPKTTGMVGSRKLAPSQVTDIRRMSMHGHTLNEIAEKHNVSPSAVSLIKRGLRLRDIGEWPDESSPCKG